MLKMEVCKTKGFVMKPSLKASGIETFLFNDSVNMMLNSSETRHFKLKAAAERIPVALMKRE